MRRRLPVIVGLACVALAGLIAVVSGDVVAPAIAWVETVATRSGPAGMVAYVVVYVAAAHLLLPASAALTVLAGVLFGFGPALALGAVASAIACATQWWVGARALGARSDALISASPSLERIEQAARAQVVRLVALARLSPLLPFALVNYAAGARRIPVGPYALGTVLGLLPSEVALVYLGVLARAGVERSSVATIERVAAAVGGAATVALVAWAWHVGRGILRERRAG